VRALRLVALLPLLLPLGACNAVVLNPAGDVAMQQRDLLLYSVGLMLIVIIPVIVLTIFFAWRYRASNTEATYDPEWDHSARLEVVIWAVPLLIIICLGALTWVGTHVLDPFRPLSRIAPGQPVPANVQPLDVEVVALDWKWLFIYPQYGIATVNEVAAPVNREIDFHITSATVMNSFFIPALAGQIYAMAGMETQLHAVINQAGSYQGLSANYSGAGFSGMHFTFKGLSDNDFNSWVSSVKTAGGSLDRGTYQSLERPTENEPVHRYASVDNGLFHAIVNECVASGSMCIDQMASVDAKGSLGMAGIHNVVQLADNRLAAKGAAVGPLRTFVAALCTGADGGYGAGKPAMPASTGLLRVNLPLAQASPSETLQSSAVLPAALVPTHS